MTQESFPGRSLLASALAYAAITAPMGRDVIAALETSIASDRGNPLLTAAILAWNATFSAPAPRRNVDRRRGLGDRVGGKSSGRSAACRYGRAS